MKINEVEAAVGVTKKNIRYYEEEGLISPRREPGNGYRSYSEADVERLRRIKLLRKLDVPLAEIRQMLEGECTLAEGMTRQLERLNTRRTDLDEAVNFCTLLQKEPVSLNELDVEQTLARLTAKEEQGVSFVNIEQTDRKAERVRGALVGAGLFTALMLFIMGIEMLTEARQIATGRMAKNAEELGADAVVGMRYASASVMQGAAEVIAYGTAVRFV